MESHPNAPPPSSTRTPLVVKIGGRELQPGPALDELARRLRSLAASGRPVVIVHGGGEEVTHRADALGLKTTKHRGQRVTSAPMLEIVVEVLAGRINTRLVAELNRAGLPAVGVSGASRGLLTVRPAGDPPGALGFVGHPQRVRSTPLLALLRTGFLPVVAPIGVDRRGQLYNVNADLAAAALAGELKADLLLLTDVAAVRDANGRDRSLLTLTQAHRLIERGAAVDGMIPKLEAGELALREGAPSVWIGSLDAITPDGPAADRGTRLVPGRTRVPVAPVTPSPLSSEPGST
jgi:acetylglutamate kinase